MIRRLIRSIAQLQNFITQVQLILPKWKNLKGSWPSLAISQLLIYLNYICWGVGVDQTYNPIHQAVGKNRKNDSFLDANITNPFSRSGFAIHLSSLFNVRHNQIKYQTSEERILNKETVLMSELVTLLKDYDFPTTTLSIYILTFQLKVIKNCSFLSSLQITTPLIQHS